MQLVNAVSLHPEFLSYPLPHVRGIRVAVGIQNKYSVLNKGSFCVILNIPFFFKRAHKLHKLQSLCRIFFSSKGSGMVESACTM